MRQENKIAQKQAFRVKTRKCFCDSPKPMGWKGEEVNLENGANEEALMSATGRPFV